MQEGSKAREISEASSIRLVFGHFDGDNLVCLRSRVAEDNPVSSAINVAGLFFFFSSSHLFNVELRANTPASCLFESFRHGDELQ